MSLFGLPADNRALLPGALSASAAAPGLGPDLLAGEQGSTGQSWHTPPGVTAAWVQVDAGAAGAAWEVAALFNTNLTPQATVRVRVGNSATFATANHDTGAQAGLVAAGYRQAVDVLPAVWTGRYLRVDLSDPQNPDGLLRAAQMFAGPARRPARAISLRSEMRRAAEAPALVTRGGQEFPDLRFARRSWFAAFDLASPDEAANLLLEVQRAGEGGGNVLFVPLPSGPHVAREAVFGRVAEAAPVTFPAGLWRGWGCTITERL